MIVDQADDIAAPAATHGRRHRPAVADHAPWPDAPRTAVLPSAPAAAATAAPVPSPGLAGLWPGTHAGVPRTARRVLPAEITAPRTARDFARATLRAWGVDEEAGGDVIIAVSELVTNALRHGMDDLPQPLPAHPIQLVLLGHPRRIVAMVTDPGAHTPEPIAQEPERSGEGGRGLLVVGGVSGAWGWARLGTGGKAVWASFNLSVPPADDASGPTDQGEEHGTDAPRH
ncbi:MULTISPECIES: ATP-binding protein [Thermomonosporaceae]|uniref:ATP-binding protein n=1 Tax=Thermomonosporaceae TaxID=2012 RepID=UPI00255A98C2|nr:MULTISPECIES: ATP-binding protein [Thermomonosporaceae]MDL4774502.1 ATP-binding protein [Actinomadura xylanilytica]